MISVEEAKQRMMEAVRTMPVRQYPLIEARGRFNAEAIVSPHDHPLFDMSAVDGYAFAFGPQQSEWRVVGEVATGGVTERSLAPGECVRIFTGAMIPSAADTVVMQEFAKRDGDRMTHNDAKLKAGGNVRRRAEQIRAGDVALPKGAALTPEACGLLASLGIRSTDVFASPDVAVIITGGEFAQPGETLPGRVFSSNDVMLAAALDAANVKWAARQIPDYHDLIAAAIKEAVSHADLVITTGGASVGDHDLVRSVLEGLRARIHFHGVAQKPGKPMLFATLGGKPVFGLPGNPRAGMVLFWEYVLPFLRAMQGASPPWLKTDRLPLADAVTLKGERAEFRAAQASGGKVILLPDEGSHMLRTLVEADALAYIPAGVQVIAAGHTVEVHYLPR